MMASMPQRCTWFMASVAYLDPAACSRNRSFASSFAPSDNRGVHDGQDGERTDPQLWEKIKQAVTDSAKGGRPGQWSARKAHLAVQRYKKAGGRYQSRKTADNSRRQWQDEDWGTKSGQQERRHCERYLPRQAGHVRQRGGNCV